MVGRGLSQVGAQVPKQKISSQGESWIIIKWYQRIGWRHPSPLGGNHREFWLYLITKTFGLMWSVVTLIEILSLTMRFSLERIGVDCPLLMVVSFEVYKVLDFV